jgi:hypothetical protein
LLQFPSFRQFKKSYTGESGLIKASRIDISTTQQKCILDKLSPNLFRLLFKRLFALAQRSKLLEKYIYHEHSYLMLVDCSGYYSSQKVSCNSCLRREKEGVINYQHHALQLFITHPEQTALIPLMAEQIRNEDGIKKQDCEINAAKRALTLLRKDHPKLKMILVGDDLYSGQPFIEQVVASGLHFIFVAKPTDHKCMLEDIDGLRRIEGVESFVIEEDGKRHYYEWVNGIELNGNKSSVKVNYFSYLCKNKVGDNLYHNSWVTDFAVNQSNVKLFAHGGRARWKCENEGFNSLKNQGYHLEHNYGHGEQNLAVNNYNLNLLSFFMHQICELQDKAFKRCHKKLGNKALIWQKIRDYSETTIFDSWGGIFAYIFEPIAAQCAIPPPHKVA